MKFKEPHLETQYQGLPTLLHHVVEDFARLSEEMGITPVITRVTDPVAGESGVHLDGRAVDVRDEHAGVFTYSSSQRESLVNQINKLYPRIDGKVTCLHHSAPGSTAHFHFQIAVETKTHRRG